MQPSLQRTMRESPPAVDTVESERVRIRARLAAGQLELPILPDVVAGVLRAVSDPDTDARRLAELVRTDAAIAAHVLRVANSSYYARGTPVVSRGSAHDHVKVVRRFFRETCLGRLQCDSVRP